MDSDSIGPLIVIAAVIISYVVKFIKAAAGEQSQPAKPASGESGDLDSVLRHLSKQLGIDVPGEGSEQPVPSEHRRTASEHRRTPGETYPSPGEHRMTAMEQRRTHSETILTKSEQQLVIPEHRVTASEHRPGDVSTLPAIPTPAPVAAPARLDPTTQLRQGGSLAQAIVLAEILGPPAGLRSPETRR